MLTGTAAWSVALQQQLGVFAMGGSMKGESLRGPLPRSSGEHNRSVGDLPAYRTVITPASDRQASVITVSHASASHHSAEDRDRGWQHGEEEALIDAAERQGELYEHA